MLLNADEQRKADAERAVESHNALAIACSNPDPNMTGVAHGIRNGWFYYPHVFDPTWKARDCANFTAKAAK